MPVIRQYYQTASERQLLTVTYTCKHCGHQNIDNDQSFLFSGASRTSVNPNRKAAGAEAEASMDRNKQRILDQIYDDKYRNAGLHCRCENCGKKPLWSTYINTSWLLVIAIVGLVFLLGAFLIQKPMMFIPAAVLIAPFVICKIINIVIDSKVKKLGREYLPAIKFRKHDSRSPEQRMHDITPPKCSTDREPEADEWKCPGCGRLNKNYVGSCGCGKEKP